MSGRDFKEVMDAVLAVIPEDDSTAELRRELQGRIQSSLYRAPELSSQTWTEAAVILSDYCREHGPQWADKAASVFSGVSR